MATYKIVWVSRLFGESRVEADSEEEAKRLASEGKDEGFEQLDPDNDWDIDSVLLIE